MVRIISHVTHQMNENLQDFLYNSVHNTTLFLYFFFLNDTLFLYFTTLIITICIRRSFLYGSPRLWKYTHSSIFEILITPLLLIGIKIIQENRWFNLIGMYTWRNQQRSMSRNFFSWLHHWVPISLSV